MSKLTTHHRNDLKKSTFGLPSQRKYPMPDKAHAANAKARAKAAYDEGHLSKGQYDHIVNMANGILKYDS